MSILIPHCSSIKIVFKVGNSGLLWQHHRGVQHQHQQLGRSLCLQTAQVFGQQSDLSGSCNVDTIAMIHNNIVQVATLIFLAIWHGFHAGYYLTFFNEFVTIMVERQFLSTWGKSAKVAKWKSHPAYSTVTSVLGWLWVWAFLPHAFIPFSLLLWSTSMQVGSSTSNSGHKKTHCSSFKGICFHLLLHVHRLCVLVPLFKGHLKTSSSFSSQGES